MSLSSSNLASETALPFLYIDKLASFIVLAELESIWTKAVIKYFPEIAKYEHERIKRVYKADLTTDYNKFLSNKWINEIEEISNDILKKKGIKPKPKPKPKPDSIMDKPKIEPKPKPKPDEKEKTWMELIKSLFN